jgi:hypothetical protein|tara:strand:+ start:8231 stop:8437 length:207 start_codon:yes stop_codon:yes gene_type:complete
MIDTEELENEIDTNPDAGAKIVYADFARKIFQERHDLRKAVRNLRDVKGRYASQIAYEQLIALLPENL